MTNSQRLAHQYDRVMRGDAWHGDAVWTTLSGISAEIAAKTAHPAAHTIWELLAHMTFWETEVCRRVDGLPPRSVEELNFPVTPEPTAENWEHALEQFRSSNESFRSTLLRVDDAGLDVPLPGRDKPLYVELDGVIQHNLYHAGHVAILRKILESNTVVTRL